MLVLMMMMRVMMVMVMMMAMMTAIVAMMRAMIFYDDGDDEHPWHQRRAGGESPVPACYKHEGWALTHCQADDSNFELFLDD